MRGLLVVAAELPTGSTSLFACSQREVFGVEGWSVDNSWRTPGCVRGVGPRAELCRRSGSGAGRAGVDRLQVPGGRGRRQRLGWRWRCGCWWSCPIRGTPILCTTRPGACCPEYRVRIGAGGVREYRELLRRRPFETALWAVGRASAGHRGSVPRVTGENQAATVTGAWDFQVELRSDPATARRGPQYWPSRGSGSRSPTTWWLRRGPADRGWHRPEGDGVCAAQGESGRRSTALRAGDLRRAQGVPARGRLGLGVPAGGQRCPVHPERPATCAARGAAGGLHRGTARTGDCRRGLGAAGG